MEKQYKKFKFRDLKFRRNAELKAFQIVNNPIGADNLPEGEYLIRGNQKFHRAIYLHIKNKWYLYEFSTKDNGYYVCDVATYQLFPNLSEKEWDKIRECNKYLSPLWKRYLSGHDIWMNNRSIKRNMKKISVKIKKK